MITIQEIKQKSEQLSEKVKQYREHLHCKPELSFQEKETAEFIKSTLRNLNISFNENIGGYGITAIIKGKNSGKTIALRADMDALPIVEKNDVPYQSQNPGVMHACGHDFHVASLLGVAEIIQNEKDNFDGSIMLIFQPAEEKSPGGALAMINDHIFDSIKPDAIIAQHAFPDLQPGMAGFRKGYYMASSDEIYITVNGKGGHGALPHLLKDPILAASQLLVSLQQINTRNQQAGNPTVLTFGKFIANGAVNIIPDQVSIEGTLRTMNEEWREMVHQRIREIAAGIAQAFQVNIEVNRIKGYPSVYNNPDFTEFSKSCALEYLGIEVVKDLDIRMTAEDFSYFSQVAPACMYRIGTGFPDPEKTFPLHSAHFDINPQSYSDAVGLLTYISLRYLNS